MAKQPNTSRTWLQYIAAFTASISSMCAGLSIGWASPALPRLQAVDSPIPVSDNQATLLATLVLIVSAVFTLPACYLSDVIGRKNTILFSGVPYLVGFLLIAKAAAVETLYIARILIGIGNGIATCVPVMYIAEISDVHIRGRLLGNYCVSFFFGTLFAYVTGTMLPISTQAVVSAVIAALLMTSFVWMPETPYYYVMKKQFKNARRSLQTLRRQQNVEQELQLISVEVNKERNVKPSSWNLITNDGLRRAFLTSVGLVLAEQMSGIIPIIVYAEMIFAEAGATFIAPSTASISLQTCLFVASFFSTLISDQCGRRPLLLVSSICSCVTLVIQGSYFFLKNVLSYDVSDYILVPVVTMGIYLMVYVCGLGNLCIPMSGEFFPMEYKRNAIICIIIFVHIGSSSATFLFELIWKTCGLHVVFFIFSTLSAISFVFIYNFVPETAKKTFREIQMWFKMDVGENEKIRDCTEDFIPK